MFGDCVSVCMLEIEGEKEIYAHSESPRDSPLANVRTGKQGVMLRVFIVPNKMSIML